MNTSTDPQNCGGCGFTCQVSLGETCSNGECQWPDGGMARCYVDGGCPSGFLCWGGGCLPPTCEFGQSSCSFGPNRIPYVEWVDLGVSGTLGTCCDGVYVDTYADPLNCGACGVECSNGPCGGGTWSGCLTQPKPHDCNQSCGPGTICAEGSCVDSRCDSPWYCLAEDGVAGLCCLSQNPSLPTFFCADLTNDPLSCGVCGLVCPAGAACINGLCNGLAECGPGHAGSYCNLDAGASFLCCPGLGCIDTSSDAQNCGACNAICGNGQICTAGVCRSP